MRTVGLAQRHRRGSRVGTTFVVVTMIAVLTILAPTASASSRKAFHLAKTCDAFPVCVVTASSFNKVPVGTEIAYADASVFPNALLPTIWGRHGTASGVCDLSAIFAGTGPGTCVFSSGTGSLSSFRAELSVTFDGHVWSWDGTYNHSGD
jgi:hypothetical protein